MLININGVATNTTTGARDVQTVTRIQDLSDVSIPTTPSEGQLLIWNGTVFNWQNSDTVNADFTVTGELTPYTLRANVDTDNAFTFRTTWENYGVTDYDLTTTLKTFRDDGNGQLAVHTWFTQAGNPWYRYVAVDTGGGDDGSHNSRLVLYGDEPEITGSAGTVTLYSNHIHTNAPLKLSSSEFAGYEGEVLLTIYSDPGNGVFNAMTYKTPAGNPLLRILTQDTGSGDDGSQETQLSLLGSAGRISANNELSISSDLILFSGTDINTSIDNNIELNCNNNFTVNSGNSVSISNGSNEISLTGSPKFITSVEYTQQSSEMGIVRRNSDGGSTVEPNSQIQQTYTVISEDGSVENTVGSFIATYQDNSTNNKFAMVVNDSTGDERNAVEVHETYTRSQQPFAFPQFDQTEINSMTPDSGWVVYNTTTDKLQVYAAGSWTDLH